MNEARTIILTGAVGGLVALLLAAPSVLPPSVASEEPVRSLLEAVAPPPPKLDVSGLVRPDFDIDPEVSLEPIRQSTVVKIGYGRRTVVQVVETASGIYSSDAMVDPHILYPGIHRKETPAPRLWAPLDGWVAEAPLGAGSFVTILPYEGGTLIVTEDALCVYTASGVTC